jgi:hypothetical protein
MSLLTSAATMQEFARSVSRMVQAIKGGVRKGGVRGDGVGSPRLSVPLTPFRACHYPHLSAFSLRISKPSHRHLSLLHPRQIVCHPGGSSCLRAKNPARLATAIRTVRWVQPPLGVSCCALNSANAPEPTRSASTGSSGPLRASQGGHPPHRQDRQPRQ